MNAIDTSTRYLASDDALRSIESSMYWPKWDAPWWHMLVLHELGRHDAIPARALEKLASAVEAFPYREFPLRDADVPEGVDPYESFCHCMLGTAVPLFAACGIDVDSRFGWVRGWLARYQMADGGLNCDNLAYLVKDEVPSSMVGTVTPVEAMLVFDAARSDSGSQGFLDRAGDFLVGRALLRGSDTKHNAEERNDEPKWRLPAFPRFYLYDVLRGLDALTALAMQRSRAVPRTALDAALDSVKEFVHDGEVRVGRRVWESMKTRVKQADGTWTRGHPATRFELLEATGRRGEPSEPLTRAWERVRGRLAELERRGLLL